MLPVRRRLVNGVAGAIGSSLSFALSARLLEPEAPVFAVLGDGTIGFHLSEFETAVRRRLPFIAVLGNDACWNAESQIQLREYGRDRMHGCELLASRYDQVVAALGGHGEFVENAADLPGAIERSLASGKPACINIMVESIAAPVIRRPNSIPSVVAFSSGEPASTSPENAPIGSGRNALHHVRGEPFRSAR